MKAHNSRHITLRNLIKHLNVFREIVKKSKTARIQENQGSNSTQHKHVKQNQDFGININKYNSKILLKQGINRIFTK